MVVFDEKRSDMKKQNGRNQSRSRGPKKIRTRKYKRSQKTKKKTFENLKFKK